MKRVALITDFSPHTGGGAANLKSWLPHLADLGVTWWYFADKEAAYPGSLRLQRLPKAAGVFSDVLAFWKLWTGRRRGELEACLAPLLKDPPDLWWVVAHGSGIAVGNLLRELTPRIPQHVSVHDDPECGVLWRSRRYRLLARLVRAPMRRLVTAARSVDVTSDGMLRYYERCWRLRSFVAHPYVPTLPQRRRRPESDGVLRVGHIGAIYSYPQFAAFLGGVSRYSERTRTQPALMLIGQQVKSAAWFQSRLPANASVDFRGEMPEPQAVAELQHCNVVYAGYPFGARAAVFRATSFPTKLSTYVQAQRPIFAHGPRDSTLAVVVPKFGVGTVCPEMSAATIADHLQQTVAKPPAAEVFEDFRAGVFGADNVARLQSALREGQPVTAAT